MFQYKYRNYIFGGETAFKKHLIPKRPDRKSELYKNKYLIDKNPKYLKAGKIQSDFSYLNEIVIALMKLDNVNTK